MLLKDVAGFSRFLDKVWANSVDLKDQSDQGLHCLPFHLYHLDTILYDKDCSMFRIIGANFSGVRNFWDFYGIFLCGRSLLFVTGWV